MELDLYQVNHGVTGIPPTLYCLFILPYSTFIKQVYIASERSSKNFESHLFFYIIVWGNKSHNFLEGKNPSFYYYYFLNPSF